MRFLNSTLQSFQLQTKFFTSAQDDNSAAALTGSVRCTQTVHSEKRSNEGSCKKAKLQQYSIV